jgi:5'-AMP-activated protein kinase catalytic alpha subunit
MEYIKGIELFDYINLKHYIDEIESCRFFQQIISGIEYLGKIKVVHRDLKPENLIISNTGTIKIVDFGLSNTYFNDNLLLTACGSPCYAAPEMVKGEEYYGICVDIWSSGVVLYAMLCGSLPFEDKDNDILYDKIVEGKFDIPNFLSNGAVDFLHGILNVDPNKRFNIQQIKNHPWFNQLNPKVNMSEGLLIKNVIVPIDDNIISIMVNQYKFKEEDIKKDLILNKYNQTTTVYYLLLRKKIRAGKETIGDMKSSIFEKYKNNSKNKLTYYQVISPSFSLSSLIISIIYFNNIIIIIIIIQY